MIKKYIVIDSEDTKYYKNVPYIPKKNFEELNSDVIVGKTILKKYKSNSENKELDLLFYNDKQYEVKEKILGFKKGYIFIGDNKYIELKKRIPFFLFLLVFLLLLFLLFYMSPDQKINEEPIKVPVQDEIVVPEDRDNKDVPNDNTENSNPENRYDSKPNKKPSSNLKSNKEYEVIFDSNGGYGNMNSIICTVDEICNLEKNQFTKEGYTFLGWSTNKSQDSLYKDNSKVENLSTKPGEKVVLYAIWEINSYKVIFLDYDQSIIQEYTINYGENIVIPENPIRKGYKFVGWDKELEVVKDEVKITALYDINDYNISYSLNGGEIENAPTNYNVGSKDIIIPSPEKIGYTFLGWTTPEDEEPIINYKIETGSIGDKNLIANYVANSYNLIFNSNDNNDSLITRKVKFDTEYGELPEVSKDGYTFLGWKDSDGEFVSSNTKYDIPEDINLYAEYEILNYNINYNLNDGELENAPTNYNVDSEDIIIPSPKKTGYTFLGWSTSEDEEPIIDYKIRTGSVGNKELTANYEPISYYISYNSSNGEGNMNRDTVLYEQQKKLSKNQFTKEGYTFLGWSTTKNGDVIYEDEAEIYNLTSKDKQIITLYAKWEIIKLDVRYYDLYGALLKEENVNYGDKSIAPEDPFIDGYTFLGWTPSINVIKSDTVYRADYSINEYTVEYDFNTGNNDDLNIIKYNVKSDKITLPIPERKGYTFLGWTGSNGLKPNLKVELSKGSIGNKKYKANWISNVYEVNFNANGGKVDVSSILVSYNSVYGTLPTPIRSGYIFDGWHFDNKLINESTLQNKDFNHELLAKWNIIAYNISYNLNGGTSSSLQTSYNIESDTFTLPIPERKGYTFLGWTGSNETIPSKNVSIQKGSTGDKSYTANWQIATYNISYNLNGGISSSLQTSYNIESDTFTLPTPERKGYTFLGWTGSNGITPSKNVSIPKGSTGDKSYTANWQVINYDITYNLAGGTSSPLQTSYNVETNTIKLPIPERTGYTFLGWTGTGLNSATKNVSINKGSIGNRNYTATWSKNYYTVNYYINNSLWTTRSVGYDEELENLNGQTALDGYHTFHGWTGWIERMPTHNVDLYANVTEAYCNLMTGHGEYGNASGLLNVFQSAGWTGHIEESPYFPGNYLVVTEFTLTRAEAEIQKNYIASHTNYTNYNFPYLYWVSVSCTNGYSEAWTRPVGQSYFN